MGGKICPDGPSALSLVPCAHTHPLVLRKQRWAPIRTCLHSPPWEGEVGFQIPARPEASQGQWPQPAFFLSSLFPLTEFINHLLSIYHPNPCDKILSMIQKGKLRLGGRILLSPVHISFSQNRKEVLASKCFSSRLSVSRSIQGTYCGTFVFMEKLRICMLQWMMLQS